MARPKKSSANPPVNPEPSTSSAHEAAENEGMAHVSADELAGSPDIFARSASKRTASREATSANADEPETVTEPEATAQPEAVAEPEGMAEPEVVAEPEPSAFETDATPEAMPVAIMPPPPDAPPPPAYAAPPATHARRAGSGVALGVVLVVVGLFFFVVQIANVNLGTYGWPLFVIIPGLTLLIVGFVSLGTGAAIPGGILTMVGLVLAYQNSSNNWASWVYVWPLVAPGGVGVGLYLQGLRDRNLGLLKQGRFLMFIAALIFMIGFVFFESILHITGTDYGLFGKAAAPALLVVIGIALLARSVQRSRKA